jgi:hypothetical protein
MFIMNLFNVLMVLCLCYSYNCSTPASDNIYKKSLSALITPSLCQLKLICVISQSENPQLKSSHFMQGISVLASYRGNRTAALMLEQAIRTGKNMKRLKLSNTSYLQELLVSPAALLHQSAGTQTGICSWPASHWG